MSEKVRLDQLVHSQELVESRQKAAAAILLGEISVNGKICLKPGTMVSPDAELTFKSSSSKFVSRGGLKLEGALEDLSVDVRGKNCLDLGASTGGFTDCLLSYGATSVTAVDVGYGQLAWKLRQDERVVVFEKTNARFLMESEELSLSKFEIVVMDLSFIGLERVLPTASHFLADTGKILALLKPQFQVGRSNVQKGGVVKDTKVHKEAIDQLAAFAEETLNCEMTGCVESRLKGLKKGNTEYFCMFERKL